MKKKYLSRYLIMSGIILFVFLAMVTRLYYMQVVQHDDYVAKAEKKSTKSIQLTGMRGTIYDADMIPLAYDARSYDVQFYRDPTKKSADDRKNYTRSIYETILLIESNGKKTLDPATEFWLKRDAYGQWTWNFNTTSETVAETRGADEVKTEAGVAAMRAAREKAGWDAEIIDKWIDYSMIQEEGYRATAVLETLSEIARPSEGS